MLCAAKVLTRRCLSWVIRDRVDLAATQTMSALPRKQHLPTETQSAAKCHKRALLDSVGCMRSIAIAHKKAVSVRDR